MSVKVSEINRIKNFSLEVKKNILDMAFSAGASSSHFGGAYRLLKLFLLYFLIK